ETDRVRAPALRGRRQPGRGAAVGRAVLAGHPRPVHHLGRPGRDRRARAVGPDEHGVGVARRVVGPAVGRGRGHRPGPAHCAAAVIGGTSIMGGRGGYGGTIVGALILTVLTALLTVLGLPEPTRQIVFGSIIVIVAAAYTRVTGET